MVRDTYSQARNYYSYLTDRRVLWEMMKMEISSATISYSKSKSKSIRNREQDIIQKLNLLDDAICNNFSSPDIAGVLQEYVQLKAELKSIYERPTKYFFNLEKRNYNKKTISELRFQDESTTNNANVILDQIETFYKNLYASEGTFSNEECDTFIRNLELPKLSDEDRDSLEGQLTYDECKKVLETLQNDKAPGEDGFTVEFYKYFFEVIGNNLLASLNEAHMKGELCISQRRGIITLTPKDDGSLLELTNWRPITLLNVAFKIASKAIGKFILEVTSNGGLAHSI